LEKLIITFFGLGLLMFIGGSIFIAILSKELPDPNKLSERQVSESTKIYDKTGDNLLYEIYQTKKNLVEIEDISPQAINATIAVEDKHFYEHRGVDIKGILRAILYDLKIKNVSDAQGASTISQQLIKTIS